MSDGSPSSPPYSPSVAVVDDASGRRIAYDAVALKIHPEEDDERVDVDVLLLHGMSPAGRKCWNFADRGPQNVPQYDAKSIARNVRRLVEAVRSGPCGGTRVAELRLVMPDRPGYGDSDPACEGIGEEEGAVEAGYSYRRFSGDMRRVLEHAALNRGPGSARRRRHLILLGTSSGGPCALALRDRLLNDARSGNVREHYTGGVIGTIICSSDGPYARRDCPSEIAAEDGKSLDGRSTREYVREESRKPFRRSSKPGWITDYTLERNDWGFELGFDGAGGAAAGRSSGGEDGSCSPTVHVYTGGTGLLR